MSISPMTAVGQSRRTNKPDELAGCPLHPQLHEICATRQNEFNVNSEREKIRLCLFCLDFRCFDYRPPLLNIVLVTCADSSRRALLVRWDFQSQVGEQPAYLRIDESLDDRAVELGDDIVARTFRRGRRRDRTRTGTGCR